MGQWCRNEAEIKAKLLLNRFIAPGGCWLWTGATNTTGYGHTRYKGKLWRVNRLSLAVFKPAEYVESLYVLHKCNNEVCFNPDHLYCGNQTDNMQDCLKAGRNPRAIQTHCKEGHEFNSVNSRVANNGQRYCIICKKQRSDANYAMRKFNTLP